MTSELRKLAEAAKLAQQRPAQADAMNDWAAFRATTGPDAILALLDDNAALRNENDRLRAALAQSDQPCAYCSLPRGEWEKCQHGFPGCSRADDAMGCPELGARMEADALRKRVEELEGALEPFARLADRLLDNGPVLGEYIKVEVRQITWNGEHDISPAALRRARAVLGGSQ